MEKKVFLAHSTFMFAFKEKEFMLAFEGIMRAREENHISCTYTRVLSDKKINKKKTAFYIFITQSSSPKCKWVTSTDAR